MFSKPKITNIEQVDMVPQYFFNIPHIITSQRDRFTQVFWDDLSTKPLKEEQLIEYIENLSIELICIHQKLSFEFIDRFFGILNWDSICRYQKLDRRILFNDKFKLLINWRYVSFFQKLDESTVCELESCLDFNALIHSTNLNSNLIKRFYDRFDWNDLCKYQKLDEECMTMFHEKLDWSNVCRYQVLSEEFMEKFCLYLDWNYVCEFQYMSENFLFSHSEHLNWNHICIYQSLSEDFIDQFYSKLNWEYVSKYQKLSKKTIQDYSDLLYWDIVSRYQKLSLKLLINIEIYVNWDIFSLYQNITQEIYNRYSSKLNIRNLQFNWNTFDLQRKISYLSCAYTFAKENDILYLVSYKAVNTDYSSFRKNIIFNDLNKKYKARCDFNCLNMSSYGFGSWTYYCAKQYAFSIGIKEFKIIKCKIPIDSVCMLKNGSIRSSELHIVHLDVTDSNINII